MHLPLAYAPMTSRVSPLTVTLTVTRVQTDSGRWGRARNGFAVDGSGQPTSVRRINITARSVRGCWHCCEARVRHVT
eukprot:5931221-Prymnesium_polylepis.1